MMISSRGYVFPLHEWWLCLIHLGDSLESLRWARHALATQAKILDQPIHLDCRRAFNIAKSFSRAPSELFEPLGHDYSVDRDSVYIEPSKDAANAIRRT